MTSRIASGIGAAAIFAVAAYFVTERRPPENVTPPVSSVPQEQPGVLSRTTQALILIAHEQTNKMQPLQLPPIGDWLHASDLIGLSATSANLLTLNSSVVETETCGTKVSAGNVNCEIGSASLLDSERGVLVFSGHQVPDGTRKIKITRFDDHHDAVCVKSATVIAYDHKLDIAFAALKDSTKDCRLQQVNLPASLEAVKDDEPQRLVMAGYSDFSDGDGGAQTTNIFGDIFPAYKWSRLHARNGFLLGKNQDYESEVTTYKDNKTKQITTCKFAVLNEAFPGMSGGPDFLAESNVANLFAGITNSSAHDQLVSSFTPVAVIVNAYNYLKGMPDFRLNNSLPEECRYHSDDWAIMQPMHKPNTFAAVTSVRPALPHPPKISHKTIRP